MSKILPADKAEAIEAKLKADSHEWYSADAVHERSASYLERLAEEKPKHIDYNKERNDLFAGFKAMYPTATAWQLKAIDWLCGMYFGTMTEERMKEGRGILIVGPTGTGKTALFKYMQSHPLIKYRIRTAYEIKRMAESGGTLALDEIKKSKWLMIDDLGTEGKVLFMGNEITPIADILHYRYEHDLVTHITMNYGAASNYDARITDRMKSLNVINIDRDARSFR